MINMAPVTEDTYNLLYVDPNADDVPEIRAQFDELCIDETRRGVKVPRYKAFNVVHFSSADRALSHISYTSCPPDVLIYEVYGLDIPLNFFLGMADCIASEQPGIAISSRDPDKAPHYSFMRQIQPNIAREFFYKPLEDPWKGSLGFAAVIAAINGRRLAHERSNRYEPVELYPLPEPKEAMTRELIGPQQHLKRMLPAKIFTLERK